MTATALLCIATLALASVRVQTLLDCNSQLRIWYPHMFKHCNCKYSDWSDWEPVPGSAVDVPTSECSSGEAYTERRTQDAIGEGCNPRTESRRVCFPDKEDRLILGLGLGSGGNDYTPIAFAPPPQRDYVAPPVNLPMNQTTPPPLTIRKPQIQAKFCKGEEICHDYWEPRGRRGIRPRKMSSRSPSNLEPSESEEAPLPFDWSQHHHRFRRQTDCGPSGIQYVLFLLDISGSIGQTSFARMTTALSRLTAFFCRPVRIAVMTFSHTFNLEFCFDCYDNTCTDRQKASQQLKGIKYRGGWTHTGGATQCACNVLLSQSCGLPPTASCISVVYITDGESNDPTKEVCKEVQCLHNRAGVETFAIGIKNYNEAELKCIADSSSTTSTFRFRSFEDFVGAINDIEQRLLQSAFYPSPDPADNYMCANPTDPTLTGQLPCIF